MKNLFLTALLLSTLLCLIAGCTSELMISGTRPAEVPIANEQWKVVAINRFNPALLDFDKEKKVAVYSHGAQEAFWGMVNSVLQDSTFLLVHTDTSSYQRLPGDNILTTEQIKEIYLQHPHHLLISLDNFDVSLSQETEREKNSDGSVSKTAHYTLITHSSWTLYDSTGHTLDRITLTESEPYQSRAVLSGLLAIGPSLGNAGPTVNKLAWDMGYRYWQRIYPQPFSHPRQYYSGKKLAEAAARMAAQDWEAAVSLLKPIAEANQKGAAKAAYNLAIVYEAMGNYKEAKYWAQAARRKSDPLALQLLSDLNGY